jgi:glycosyltransferase involved in cell wall biosynthesis
VKPTVALVNGAAKWDGTRFGAQTFRAALTELGYPVTWYQCQDYGRDSDLPEADRFVPGFGFPNEAIDMGLNRLLVFPRRLRMVREDVLLLMDPTLVDAAPGHPRTAVRIHDLRPLSRFADRWVTTRMYRHALPRLRSVARVLVPTESTAAELRAYRIPPAAIRVVPETQRLGIHPDHLERSRRRVDETGVLRVLCVASDRPYKGIDLFLRIAGACARVAAEPQIRFRLVSRVGAATGSRIRRDALPNLEVVRDVADMRAEYDGADVLAFPSSYEGFGRPVLEAMAYGLPTIAHRIAPIDTIVADAGRLVRPGNLAEWLGALHELADPAVRVAIGSRALARAERYSPEHFRDAVAAAFDDL